MSQEKSNFKSFLSEFDGTGFGNAYSMNVLQHTQLTQDPEGDEKEEKKDREDKLRKELEAALAGETNNDDSHVVDGKETSDGRILKHLKNLLYKMPGADGVEDEELADQVTDVVTNNGRELMSGDQPVRQPGYKNFDDPNNARKMPDGTFANTIGEPDDQHEQLIAAIRELRDELRKSRGGEEPAIEQEEDVEEDEGEDTTQFANAGKMFQTLVNQKMSRGKIISQFEKNLGVTNSTAVSYYQRLAKNAGLTNSGDRELPGAQPPGLGMAGGFGGQDPTAVAGDPTGAAQPEASNVSGIEIPNDPNRQGLIRTVKGAHLVYKRRNEEGTFDELWVFALGDSNMEGALKVRRDILAGTDIPPRAVKSANGSQSYTLKTLGNGQILHIKGLPN